MTANLRVKEVQVSETERFVVCHNPDAADRDAAVRANLVERLETMIADTDRLSPTRRAELPGVANLREHLARYPLGEADLIFANEVGGVLRRTLFRSRVWRRRWCGLACSAR